MGRLAKNYRLHAGSYAIGVPIGSSVVGPQSPQTAQIRFNGPTQDLEIFYNSAWHVVGVTGRVGIAKDVFLGNGVTTTFTMFHAPVGVDSYLPGQESDLLVFVGGVFQESSAAYTVNGPEISFTGTPDLGVPIVVLHNFNSTYVR